MPYTGNMRLRLSAGTKYAVSFMPSGSKMYSFISSSMPRPAAFSQTCASTSVATLYRHWLPGWNAIGCSDRRRIISSSDTVPSLLISARW